MKIKRNILLNPGPATTSDDVKLAMVVPDICPREVEFCRIMDSIKADLPKVVHGESDYAVVLFASSGTGAMEAAITSAVPHGSHILVVNNGAYGARAVEIAETYGINVVPYALAYGDYPKVDEIRGLLKQNKKLSHIAVVDHETTTGMRNPIQEICDMAHERHVEVIVDCISSYAGLPIDLRKWKAEYIACSSNKCIQGMAGLSFVMFRKELIGKIKKNRRAYYFDLFAQYAGFLNTGQMQFTPPVQVVYALRKALDLLFNEGIENRIERYRNNFSTLYSGLKEMGFSFLLEDSYQSGILLAVKEPRNAAYSFSEMHDYLYARGFTIYPGKGAKEPTFRLSILGDLYKQDVVSFLSALKGYLTEKKITRIE